MISSFLTSVWKFIQTIQKTIGTILFLLIMYLFIGFLLSDTTPQIRNGSALVIDPKGYVVEQLTEKDTLEIILGSERDLPPEILLRDVVRAIKLGKSDNRISSLILRLDYMFPMGASKLHYIGQAIEDFKTSGKPVYAYGGGFSQGNYLVASHADEIYMHPEGNILLTGYGIYPTYYKGALEKIGANINVFKVGEYKSAVEPYIRQDMSPAAKEANQELVSSLWEEWVSEISMQRNLEDGKINASFETISEDLKSQAGDFALYAKELGLIDGLMTRNQWQKYIRDKVGRNGNGGFKQINLENYLLANPQTTSNFDDEVAVIVASGTIMAGEQPSGIAGGDTIARQLRKARYDNNVKAIVLRVDSPGGSLFGSEIIREEVDLNIEAGKPVFVSMGSLAASGGYWISATATEIWASPTTITGSIGIFSIIPTFENTLNKIGVNVDGVGTTPLSGAFNPTRGLTEDAKEILAQSTQNGYNDFINLVSKGRNIPIEDVEKIAQGRPWDGKKALELGLVDNLGTLDEVIKSAAHEVGLSSYSIKYIEDTPNPGQQFAEYLFGTASLNTNYQNQPTLGATKLFFMKLIKDAKILTSLNDPSGLYAICNECIVE